MWSQWQQYQRCSLFRDGQGNFEFIVVLYQQDNWQRSYKTLNQACRQNDICTAVDKNSHEPTFEYTGVKKQIDEKSPISSSSSFLLIPLYTQLLTSIAHQLKQFLSYITHRTTLLSLQYPLLALLSARLIDLTSYGSITF